MEKNFEKIKKFVGSSEFIKGRNYLKYYVRPQGVVMGEGASTFLFDVESESTYDVYKVRINVNKGEILSSSCTCPQHARAGVCKHVAASLINHREEIFNFDPKERVLNISRQILKEFKPEVTNTKREVKKELTLEVE